jgi:hypothetical protein
LCTIEIKKDTYAKGATVAQQKIEEKINENEKRSRIYSPARLALKKCIQGKVQTRMAPGVDVMITIFCDFRQFSEKMVFFFKKTNNLMVHLSHNSAVF